MAIYRSRHILRRIIGWASHQQCSFRWTSSTSVTLPVSGHGLKYHKHGDPATVLMRERITIKEVKEGQILVKMLAAAVNQSDFNMIEGTYGIKPKQLPSVPGIEGVGEVVHAEAASGLKPGDWVVPKVATGFLGTWQPYIVANNGDLIKLQSKVSLASAATILVNPCSAYRMLKEYETLKPGDCVLQNGGNSAVGEAVIQLCREFQLKCISLIRPRPKFELKPLKARLLSLGNRDTKIITEDELTSTMRGKRAQLGLDCVGGKSATEVIRFLESSRTMVTYGGMSRDPVIIRSSQLIFNDIRLKGFWLSRDAELNSFENQTKVINELASLVTSGKLVPPVHKLLPLAKYRVALRDSIKGQKGVKYIITFDTMSKNKDFSYTN